MKHTLMYRLGYWLQRVVVCPFQHGRYAAHGEHVQAEQARAMAALREKFGENLERMPMNKFVVVGGGDDAGPVTEPGPYAGLSAFDQSGKKPN